MDDVTAAGASLGTTPKADAMGRSTDTGTVTNKIVVGTNRGGRRLDQPAELQRGTEFAVRDRYRGGRGPWLRLRERHSRHAWALLRGISDTLWCGDAYQPILAATRAQVTEYLVKHLGSGNVDKAPVTTSDLSSIANATRAGHLVASRVAYTVSPVTEIGYTRLPCVDQTLTGAPSTRWRANTPPPQVTSASADAASIRCRAGQL